MSKWKQVGGDMTWEAHGVALAKLEESYGQVELVQITPWLEHDREAAVSHGLYLIDRTTIDVEDLSDDAAIEDAIRSAGMSREEYEEMSPEYKALVLVGHGGYDESRSTDRLADALPAPAEEIEFWGGAETAEKLDAYDQEMRRAVLDASFETRLSFGEMPPRDALTFAFGDGPLEMELSKSDELALAYAATLAKVAGSTESVDDFVATVKALTDAPEPGRLEHEMRTAYVRAVIADWNRRYGNADDDERGVAAAARSLASSLMEAIGFEWV